MYPCMYTSIKYDIDNMFKATEIVSGFNKLASLIDTIAISINLKLSITH